MTDPSRRAPLSADVLPASGAWRPGDEPGHRRFLTTPTGRPFALEGGGVLSSVTVAYETWGELSADASNAILLCHALTGDSHAAGSSGHGHPTEGWWNGLVGPGRAFDTDRYFVVCANVLGGCQGSTGPSSIDPATGRPYGSAFPVVTIRDMVRSQALVADHLGIAKWLAVAGGSMGGMQVLEWGVMFPERVRSLIPIATTLAASAWQIGLSSVQRSTIVLDPKWRGGDYYDAADGDGPHLGLALARQTAHITYQSDPSFERKFGRNEEDPMDEGFTPWQRFSVENYLDYQGAKLVRRFDANSYLVINRAMDLHDVGRGRGGLERAVRRITAPVLTASISSDVLYPPHQQKLLHDMVAENGVRARHVLVESQAGHDGFLIEDAQIAAAVVPFLDEIERRR
ncbi:MAG: homoserine O-acetyltransferase [Acidimicrobiia bacterium]|nr:homoserine O-acetyltransferase [Acidimicrobiia bacterium]